MGAMKRSKFALLIFLSIFLSHCETKHKNSCSTPSQAHGFAFSPLGFPHTYTHTTEFFEDIERMKDAAVMWNGSWRDDAVEGSDAGDIPEAAALIADSAIEYCYVPLAVFGWRFGSTNYIQIPTSTINDWTNVEARRKFISMLVDYVIKYRPPYVFLGNENDFYYESNVADYAHWIISYNAAYDAIKEVSETTLVGPVFNYEHISGNGILNNWNTSFWEALDSHDLDKVDVLGLTVYPFFNYVDPSDVPNNYLKPFIDKIGNRPIVITETGWPAENINGLNPPWVTTEEAQVEYVQRLQRFTSTHTYPVINWLYYNGLLSDETESDTWKTFGSISIKNRQGNEYQVYNPWLDL